MTELTAFFFPLKLLTNLPLNSVFDKCVRNGSKLSSAPKVKAERFCLYLVILVLLLRLMLLNPEILVCFIANSGGNFLS